MRYVEKGGTFGGVEAEEAPEGQGAGLASVVSKDGWAGGRLLGLLPASCFLFPVSFDKVVNKIVKI